MALAFFPSLVTCTCGTTEMPWIHALDKKPTYLLLYPPIHPLSHREEGPLAPTKRITVYVDVSFTRSNSSIVVFSLLSLSGCTSQFLVKWLTVIPFGFPPNVICRPSMQIHKHSHARKRQPLQFFFPFCRNYRGYLNSLLLFPPRSKGNFCNFPAKLKTHFPSTCR